MKIAEPGLAIIKFFEGLRLKAYLCPAGVWTIGYGHTKGVKKGDVCTSAQADAWLREDCEDAERAVNTGVRVPITQNQFDALVSFVFNLGAGAFSRSTLLRRLNGGDYAGAATELLRWNKAGGKVLAGLTARREAERDLFLTYPPEAA